MRYLNINERMIFLKSLLDNRRTQDRALVLLVQQKSEISQGI